jgi:hypothetical protein
MWQGKESAVIKEPVLLTAALYLTFVHSTLQLPKFPDIYRQHNPSYCFQGDTVKVF